MTSTHASIIITDISYHVDPGTSELFIMFVQVSGSCFCHDLSEYEWSADVTDSRLYKLMRIHSAFAFSSLMCEHTGLTPDLNRVSFNYSNMDSDMEYDNGDIKDPYITELELNIIYFQEHLNFYQNLLTIYRKDGSASR